MPEPLKTARKLQNFGKKYQNNGLTFHMRTDIMMKYACKKARFYALFEDNRLGSHLETERYPIDRR